jgi:hypothetical protein
MQQPLQRAHQHIAFGMLVFNLSLRVCESAELV